MACRGIERGASRGWIGATRGILCGLLAAAGCHASGPRTGEAVVEVGSPGESAAPKPAGVCSASGYCWENPLPMASFYSAVWASGPSDMYAVGNGGRALHFDGRAWEVQKTGVTEWLGAVWGSDKDNVYATSDSGAIVHRKGGVWKKEETLFAFAAPEGETIVAPPAIGGDGSVWVAAEKAVYAAR